MAAPILYFLLHCWIVSGTIGSDPNSDMSLKQKALEVDESISSTPIAIQAGNEKMLPLEFQELLSNHSLRVGRLEEDVAKINQNLRNQTVLIERMSRQLQDLQSLSASSDPYFSLRARFVENTLRSVTCSTEDTPRKIEFSRVLDTGSGGALPAGVQSHSGSRAAVLDLSDVQREDTPGIFECWYERDGKRREIYFLINQDGWLDRPQVAIAGDTTQLSSQWPDDVSIRWMHDGEHVPSWDGRGNATIAGLKKEDAGFYEVYFEGDRQARQWFFWVSVRACPANFFGERCERKCTTCYNGGDCHEMLGTCVCPPGFNGERCEEACGENRFGPNCSESCDGGDCFRTTFCKPNPYGCSCAQGFRGPDCDGRCIEGTFGVDCEQFCHCAKGSCDPHTGACSSGCSRGWTGQSCQIPDGN